MNIQVDKTEQQLFHMGCAPIPLPDGMYEDQFGSVFLVNCNMSYQLNNPNVSGGTYGISEEFALKAMCIARGDTIAGIR